MKRKEAVYKGLQFTDVWFTDTSLTSPDYFQITEFPTRLTAGKNLFKLRGHPTNLRVGGYLNIEVLDYNGDPIYHEVIDYIDEDKSRVIAIYIYEETSPGDCIITLLAEAVNVPSEWKGRGNIKWMRSVPVNPNISNISEIIFETVPELVVNEQIGPHLDRIYSGSVQFPTLSTGTVRYFLYNGQSAVELSNGLFTSDMSTGTLTVTTPINPSPTPVYTPSTTTYVSTVKKILSPSLALLDTEYTVYSSQSISSHTYRNFDASAFTLSYEATPQYIATENSESFALIQIKNLDPATGDVSRVKVFMNNKGTVGTWELINDIELDETEIFITSTGSIEPDRSIGIFTSQSIIDTYWDAHTYQGFVETTAPTLIYNTASLNAAMQIQNATDISAKNTVSVAQIKSAYQGTFLAGSEYKITFDALGTRTGTSNPKLALYLSGSALNYDTTDYFNSELPVKLGKRIGDIEVTTDNQRFDDRVFSFTADNDGEAVLLVVIEQGEWQIADIRTTTDNDSGYSPNYTRIRTLVPTSHKSENQLSFKSEYYNVNGEKSKQISYAYDKNWEGGNRYIDGDYSMLTGSLYVADSLESGVAISGYKNTGFVRSLGYEGFTAGFPGFLLWSGSALSGSLGTKGGVPYSGVGLELYANTASYFRYSTTDSEIDVRTNKFFFGNSGSTYISGSNGKLEISAENFSVSANGDVFAADALFGGGVQADLFKYRTRSTGYILGIPLLTYRDLLIQRYLHGGKPYCSLMLTSSYSPEWNSTSPGTIIEIESLPAPLTSIYILNPTASFPEYSKYGSIIHLRATNDFYIEPLSYNNDFSPPGQGGGGDIYINSSSFISGLQYSITIATRNSNALVSDPTTNYTYDVLKIPTGTTITLIKGFENWEIIAASAFPSEMRANFFSGITIGDVNVQTAPKWNTIQFNNLPTESDTTSLDYGMIYVDTTNGYTIKMKN
jgi:hypothetical protein